MYCTLLYWDSLISGFLLCGLDSLSSHPSKLLHLTVPVMNGEESIWQEHQIQAPQNTIWLHPTHLAVTDLVSWASGQTPPEAMQPFWKCPLSFIQAFLLSLHFSLCPYTSLCFSNFPSQPSLPFIYSLPLLLPFCFSNLWLSLTYNSTPTSP